MDVTAGRRRTVNGRHRNPARTARPPAGYATGQAGSGTVRLGEHVTTARARYEGRSVRRLPMRSEQGGRGVRRERERGQCCLMGPGGGGRRAQVVLGEPTRGPGGERWPPVSSPYRTQPSAWRPAGAETRAARNCSAPR
ncbi:hypothetical protein GCM10010261_14130 [Streptomyces pilosus]|nr:hypothetical protein GCM10010261_14130 [Streptomyces pilosus]